MRAGTRVDRATGMLFLRSLGVRRLAGAMAARPAKAMGLLAVSALAFLLSPSTLQAQLSGDYRSAATGNWGTASTWETYNGSGWVAAGASPTSASGVITIRSPHTVTVTSGLTIDQTTIDVGGQVTVNSGILLNVANGSGTDLTVNGTLSISGTVALASSVTLVDNGSITIPNGGLLSGSGGSSATKPTTTVASGGTLTIDSGGSLTGSGSGPMIFAVALGGVATIDGTISGVLNFTVAGTLTASNNISIASVSVVSITGTMTQTAGTFTVARGSSGTTGSVGSGGTLALTGSSVLSIGAASGAHLDINSGGTLDMGPSAVVSGAGLLQVDSGANLKIGSADGINTGTTTGNVRTTATDTYNAGGNYTYDGTAAQVTGNALPASIAGLTINNSSGVTLSRAGDTTVTTALSLQSGVLNAGANKVIIPATGSVTATSGWVYATGAGGLQENVATGSNVSRTFPIGTATASEPLSVTFASVTTAGNLIAKTTGGDHPNIGTSTLNSSQSVNEYWTLTNSGIVFTTYSAVLNFNNPADLDAGTNTSALLVGKYVGGWSYPTVGTRTSTSTQATGLTTFGDFQLAEGNAAQTRVETAADGSGSVVGAQNITAGSSITVYAISRDANGIFLRNLAATWSLANVTGGVVAGDLVASGDSKSATFTGHLTGSARIQAVASGFTGQSGTQTVIPGPAVASHSTISASPTSITANGTSTSTITVQARDAYDNNLTTGGSTVVITKATGGGTLGGTTDNGNGTYTATLTSPTTIGSATFTATLGDMIPLPVGVGSPATVTYIAGAATQLRVETASDGSGTAVPSQDVTAGSSLIVYAISRDANDHFVANVAADSWSLVSKTAGVVDGDLVASVDRKSATFTGHVAGTAVIHASRAARAFGTSDTPLAFNTGEDNLYTAVIDPAGGFAYYGTYTSPGKVVKVRLSDFTEVSTLTLSTGEDDLFAAVIDTAGGFAYFGTNTSPGRVAKVDINPSHTFAEVGSAIQLATSEDSLYSAAIDPANGFAYFGTYTSPGRVAKVDINPSHTFAEVGSAIQLATGENQLYAAVFDPATDFAYFSTHTIPGRVAKVDINPIHTFAEVGSAIQLASGEDYPAAAVIDPAGGFVYFGTGASPGKVVKVRLSDFTEVDALTLSTGENNLFAAVIDPEAAYAYFGTVTSPGIVARVNLDTPALAGDSGTLTVVAGLANKLAFGTQPSNTSAGSSITPAVTVRIEDAYGNLTSSTLSVTVAIGTNPSGGTLSGILTHAAVGGVATFDDLSIDQPGIGYTLTAAATGCSMGACTGTTSGTFDITTVGGYWVNNATGSDSNAGTQGSPFATIGHAVSVMGNSGTVFVQVGDSQSGSPYAANIEVTAAQAGTASQQTLIQGVVSGGVLPLVQGTDPTADAGFDVKASYVTVDGFEIQNTLVGVYSEASNNGAQISNNYIVAGHLAYGIILDGTSSASVYNNRVEQISGGGSFFGIWDYSGNGNVIELNKVTGHGSDGIVSHYSTGLVIRRNILKNNPVGIEVSNAGGPVTLYNNTVDGSAWLGIYVEHSPFAVTSRNNIVSNGGYGWAWDGIGTISSNFDDVYNNLNNYNYTAPVTPGANSISANPLFVQTTDPTLATYYQLNTGSPCIDAGTDVGFGTSIGAVQ